jgi:hypothetical protein
MDNHGTQNSQPQFSFQNFFQEAQKDLPFHQRPEPNTAALRMDRKPSTVGPDGSSARENQEEQPLWKRLPAWVYIVSWIATSSAVILQVRTLNKHPQESQLDPFLVPERPHPLRPQV